MATSASPKILSRKDAKAKLNVTRSHSLELAGPVLLDSEGCTQLQTTLEAVFDGLIRLTLELKKAESSSNSSPLKQESSNAVDLPALIPHVDKLVKLLEKIYTSIEKKWHQIAVKVHLFVANAGIEQRNFTEAVDAEPDKASTVLNEVLTHLRALLQHTISALEAADAVPVAEISRRATKVKTASDAGERASRLELLKRAVEGRLGVLEAGKRRDRLSEALAAVQKAASAESTADGAEQSLGVAIVELISAASYSPPIVLVVDSNIIRAHQIELAKKKHATLIELNEKLKPLCTTLEQLFSNHGNAKEIAPATKDVVDVGKAIGNLAREAAFDANDAERHQTLADCANVLEQETGTLASAARAFCKADAKLDVNSSAGATAASSIDTLRNTSQKLVTLVDPTAQPAPPKLVNAVNAAMQGLDDLMNLADGV